ncbi:uncharacterized protein LOC132743954 [Ruditapes philippinarum]|uniref:uncharacterized protein LOC132743954 n=1 Tax=Ruditapes philippinarum TaxID=129788 RepID=UPI00295C1B75|nr:uncharacterized protein LOC132743954 [Ruditapes philippinarum]
MYSTQCPDCYKGFSRKDAMLRHFKQKHNVSVNTTVQEGAPPPPPPQGALPPPPPPQGELPPPSPPPRQQQQENFVFLHPFTMMISGPTACGKTTMVKKLLENHNSKIQPSIQRIVWLYKRWQPLYTTIQSFVLPRIEFIKGIPSDLDDDEFFNPRINNLLILDDLFSESGKDKRITDLFTEGSHHRSLSVISINQNLFGNKDPTQRRNCHYLVLFNNPVDKQSMMTLARQMYPGQSDILLKQFASATKYPYGYLLVDLKPFTPENQRLRSVRQNNQHSDYKGHVTLQEPIKDEVVPEANHSAIGLQTGHIEDYLEPKKSQDNYENNSEEIMENKGQACDDCGQLFDTVHDVQRHVKSGWCPEHRESRKRKHEELSDSEHEEDSVEDNEAYVNIWKRARKANDEKFDRIYNKFVDDGEESDEAQEMAEERIQPYNEKMFFDNYTMLIDNFILPLRNSDLHNNIMAQIYKSISKGLHKTKAVQKVLKKHKTEFEDLFEMELSDDEESDDEESDVSEAETED